MPPDVKKDASDALIESRLSKIEQELVNPDDGVYARMSGLREEMRLSFADLKNSITQLIAFKQDVDKTGHGVKIADVERRCVDVERRIADVEKWKTSLINATIWLTTILLTGVVGLGFKILFDVFSRKLIRLK